jgi:hypothetical protein
MDVSDRMDQTDTRQSNYDRSSESRRSKRVGGDSSRHVVCGGAINGSPELELAHTMGLQARFSLHLDDLWDEGILTEGLAGSGRQQCGLTKESNCGELWRGRGVVQRVSGSNSSSCCSGMITLSFMTGRMNMTSNGAVRQQAKLWSVLAEKGKKGAMVHKAQFIGVRLREKMRKVIDLFNCAHNQ